MDSFFQKIFRPAAIVFIIGYGVALIVLGACYTWPNEEGFTLTAEARDKGILGAAEAMLTTFDGRYFTDILHGFNPLAFGWLGGYKLMPLLGFLLFAGSSAFLLRSFFELNLWRSIMCGFIFASVHFALAPTLTNELYNMIASFVYLYGICLWMVWVGALARFTFAKTGRDKNVYFLLCAIGIIASTGTNEQVMMLNAMSLAFALVLYLIFARGLLVQFLPLFFTGLICCVFFLSCPGLRLRAASFEGQHHYRHLGGVLSVSTGYYWQTFKHLFAGSWLLFPALLFAALMYTVNPRFDMEEKRSGIIMWLTFLFIALASYLVTFTYYLPMGNEGIYPERIYAVVSTLLQVAFCLLAFFIQPRVAIMGWQYFALAWCGISLGLASNNYSNVRKEYNDGTLATLDNIMRARVTRLEAAKSGKAKWKQACFESTRARGNMVFYPNIFEYNRQQESYNVALEKWFRLNEVGFCDDTITKRETLQNIMHEE